MHEKRVYLNTIKDAKFVCYKRYKQILLQHYLAATTDNFLLHITGTKTKFFYEILFIYLLYLYNLLDYFIFRVMADEQKTPKRIKYTRRFE